MDSEVFFVFAPRRVLAPEVVFHADGLFAHHRRQIVHRCTQFVVAHRGIFALQFRASGIVEEFRKFGADIAADGLAPVIGCHDVFVGHFHFPQQPFRRVGTGLPAHDRVVLVGCSGGVQRLVLARVVHRSEPEHRVIARSRFSGIEFGRSARACLPLLALSGPTLNRPTRNQILELVFSAVLSNLPQLGIVGVCVFSQCGFRREVEPAVAVGRYRLSVVGIAHQSVVFAAGDGADIIRTHRVGIDNLPFRVVALRLVGIDVGTRRTAHLWTEIALHRSKINAVVTGILERPGRRTRVRRVPICHIAVGRESQRLVGAFLGEDIAVAFLGDDEQATFVVECRGVHDIRFGIFVVQKKVFARSHMFHQVAFIGTELWQSHCLLSIRKKCENPCASKEKGTFFHLF